MRVVVQRSKQANVRIDDNICGEINHGLVVLVGFEHQDTVADSEWMAKKLSHLRIFSDENGKMNRSIVDVDGQFLVISQFTLHALSHKGNRPSYIRAAPPQQAIPLYEYFIEQLKIQSKKIVQTGRFGADMQVQLINDGPVTIFIDSRVKEH